MENKQLIYEITGKDIETLKADYKKYFGKEYGGDTMMHDLDYFGGSVSYLGKVDDEVIIAYAINQRLRNFLQVENYGDDDDE